MQYKKISSTIFELRKKYDLCDVLEIDDVKMGRNIELIKARKEFKQKIEQFKLEMSQQVAEADEDLQSIFLPPEFEEP